MVKGKKKNDHGRGFKRTQKQWENSFSDHLGKFIDRLTFTDVLNIAAFSATAITTYRTVSFLAEQEWKPEWWQTALGLAVFPMGMLAGALSVEGAKSMDEMDKIAVSILAGYGTIKLAPMVTQLLT